MNQKYLIENIKKYAEEFSRKTDKVVEITIGINSSNNDMVISKREIDASDVTYACEIARNENSLRSILPTLEKWNGTRLHPNVYYFQYEVSSDVLGLLNELSKRNIQFTINYTDTGVRLEVEMDIGELITIINLVPDGHVMERTLVESELFRGEN